MRVKVIVVGKPKEHWSELACGEYCKRLRRFCKLEFVVLPDATLPRSPKEAEIEAALQSEGKAILSQSVGDLIALCVEGKGCSSEVFSSQLLEKAVRGTSTVTFAVGSSFGLSQEVKQQAKWRLSFSEMTFPHHLAQVMLLEQIYRAFQIGEGGKYHK